MSQISWENSPWKQLSLVNDEEVISLSHAKVNVFSDSVSCLGKVNQNPTSNIAWEQQLDWFKDSSQYRFVGHNWRRTDGPCSFKRPIFASRSYVCVWRHRHSRILLRDLLRSRVWTLHRELEVLEAEAQVVKWPIAVQGLFQRNLHHSFLWKWHPPECLFYKSGNGCRFGEKCSYAHRRVDEQPSKRSKKNGDKSAVAILKITRQLVCVSQDMEPPKSTTIFRKSSKHTEANPMFSIRWSRVTSC